MVIKYPHDFRELDFGSDAQISLYLRKDYYSDETMSYLSWLEPDLCTEVREYIAIRCSVPLDTVIIVGSARLGFSTKNGLPFEIGFSDLDIALVNAGAFYSLRGQTPEAGDWESGCAVRPDHHPNDAVCALVLQTAREASRIWSNKFSAVSIAIYPSVDAVAERTGAALRKWRALFRTPAEVASSDAHILTEDDCYHIKRSSFAVFANAIEDSSPLNSGPYVMSYNTMLRVLRSIGNREAVLHSLSDLIEKLREYIHVEVLMIGGSSLIEEISRPGDIDCALFYSPLEKAEVSVGLENAMKWVRRYRQNGVDMRLFPADGPKWLTIKLAGYMTALFCSSKAQRKQGPIIVIFD